MTQNIFITGCTGYLGSQLVHRLAASGKKVVGLKRTTSSLHRLASLPPQVELVDRGQIDLRALFHARCIDTVIHCATDYGRGKSSSDSVLDANVHLPTELLDLTAGSSVRRFVNIDTVLDQNLNDYSRSKKFFLRRLHEHAGGFERLNVSLHPFYGPGEGTGKFVSDMIRKLLKSETAIDLTPGRQERDFTYIDDVLNAFDILLGRGAGADGAKLEYAVGAGHPISIRALLEKLKALVGNSTTELRFGALPYRENELMHFPVNDTASMRELGWLPQTSLEAGLRATIHHLRETEHDPA